MLKSDPIKRLIYEIFSYNGKEKKARVYKCMIVFFKYKVTVYHKL